MQRRRLIHARTVSLSHEHERPPDAASSAGAAADAATGRRSPESPSQPPVTALNYGLQRRTQNRAYQGKAPPPTRRGPATAAAGGARTERARAAPRPSKMSPVRLPVEHEGQRSAVGRPLGDPEIKRNRSAPTPRRRNHDRPRSSRHRKLHRGRRRSGRVPVGLRRYIAQDGGPRIREAEPLLALELIENRKRCTGAVCYSPR